MSCGGDCCCGPILNELGLMNSTSHQACKLYCEVEWNLDDNCRKERIIKGGKHV